MKTKSSGQRTPVPTEKQRGHNEQWDRFQRLVRKVVNTPKPKPDEDES